jgi:hypothetical protein
MTKNIVILAFKGEKKEKVSDNYYYNGNRQQTQRGEMDMTKVMMMIILLSLYTIGALFSARKSSE